MFPQQQAVFSTYNINMSQVVEINNFFRTAVKNDVEEVRGKMILSERQEFIFDHYYLKKQNVNFIADSLFISPEVINRELRIIRGKIAKILGV